MKNNIKVNTETLKKYYKIYCCHTPNIKNRMFKEFDEFAYMISRAGMINSLRAFNRKSFNISKLHAEATSLLAFGDKEAFLDVDPDNLIPKCSTIEASLRIMKNKNIDEILEGN